MSEQEGLPPDVLQMQKDHASIRESILSVTMGWAALENTLAAFLEDIIGNPKAAIGCAIYFAIGSAETRFALVDKAFTAFLAHAPQGPERDGVIAEWLYLMRKLASARGSRNKIIHGNVVTVAAFGKNYARLTPPMLDFFRMGHDPNQLPGMSADDVLKIAKRIWDMNGWVMKAVQLIPAIRNADAAALQRILRELAIHRLTIIGHPSAAPNPPAPSTPPQS